MLNMYDPYWAIRYKRETDMEATNNEERRDQTTLPIDDSCVLLPISFESVSENISMLAKI